MEIKHIVVKQLYKIPNAGGCTNIGGIVLTPTGRMYAIKTKQDNSKSAIYRFPDYKKEGYTIKKYAELGHGNGLAYAAGWLAIPPCGYELHMINANTLKHIVYKSGKYVSAVAYRGGGVWLVKSTGKIYTMKLTPEGTITVISGYKIENPMVEKGFTVSQDIAYHNGRLYHVYSHKEKNQNCILVSNLERGKTAVNEVYISDKMDSLYEWESLDFSPDGDLLIAANTEKGDYIYKGVKL